MKIKFCPKCGKLLIPIKHEDKFFLSCKPCNYIEEIRDEDFLDNTEKLKEKIKVGIGVNNDKNIYATYPHECSKCGHIGAEVLDKGPQYSDEDTIIQYKCGKCEHVDTEGEAY